MKTIALICIILAIPATAPPRVTATCKAVRQALVHASQRTAVPLSVVYALGYTESRCKPAAIGRHGEWGLTQVMPDSSLFCPRCKWWVMFGPVCGTDPFNPYVNACVGAHILRHHYARTGCWASAILAYQGGDSVYLRTFQEALQ